MKRFCSLCLCLLLIIVSIPVSAAEDAKSLTILFTHDTHDYLYPTTTLENGSPIAHGGAAKLKTLIQKNTDENTLYLDAGDFSMGTLYQTLFSTEAPELRNLGQCGCAVTTFGNHEFDYGLSGVTKMLKAAMKSGDTLPAIVQSNIDFSGELTDEQKAFQKTLEEYGVKEYSIITKAGLKIGIFGLMGYDCIECTQSDLSYIDYMEAAKATVEKLKNENCDLIVALSHSGTEGNGNEGEDVDLAKAVPDIDIIVSGHTHSVFEQPVQVGNTIIVSSGEYLKYVGKLQVSVSDGTATVKQYTLLPVDLSVAEDKTIVNQMETYKKHINDTYLKNEKVTFDQVIAYSSMNFMPLNDMYDTHQEYDMGDFIADSYLYEAEKNGIHDIDVALVGLGTIRGSIKEGYISVADAFEICSLGVGADGSAGHPLVTAYITGEELKLLTELDASLGPMVSSVKMSYSGLEYTFNTKRVILDRVTDVHLVRPDGTREEIQNDRLYKVTANMYAVNMLGMLNGLTKGILKITPKNADGTVIEDFYKNSMRSPYGIEIKEWVALKDYLCSFSTHYSDSSTLPAIPTYYFEPLGRKNKTEESGIAVIEDPGTATHFMSNIIMVVNIITILLLVFIIVILVKKKRSKSKPKS